MLETNYLGLKLKNPLVAGSSGLTATISQLRDLEKQGLAAVVLKSLFEEDIYTDFNNEIANSTRSDEELDTLDIKIKHQHLDEYSKLIREAKAALKIPVIASINCTSTHEWAYFASMIEKAGADALELNIYEIPFHQTSASESEQRHIHLVRQIIDALNIPVAVKISPYHTSTANFCRALEQAGASGITLFNRFLSPDFDPQTFSFKEKNKYSHPEEYYHTLRWTALLGQESEVSLCASCGIHETDTILKMIAAGASACQLVSVLYKNGIGITGRILEEMQNFLHSNGYSSLREYQTAAKKHLKLEYFLRSQFVRLKNLEESLK